MKFSSGILAVIFFTSFFNTYAGEGEVLSKNKKGIVHFSIIGQSARDIDKALTNAPRTPRLGLSTSVVKGKHVFCKTEENSASDSYCNMTLDENGLINSNLFKQDGLSTGKVKTEKVGERVEVTITGEAAEQMLSGMRNVTAFGIINKKKDSGDIKCSVLKEVKFAIARCTFFLDSNGSPSSK